MARGYAKNPGYHFIERVDEYVSELRSMSYIGGKAETRRIEAIGSVMKMPRAGVNEVMVYILLSER